jgi:hypothetical protein
MIVSVICSVLCYRDSRLDTFTFWTASMHCPPPVPQDISYTKFYCEENIYKLVEAFTTNEEIRGFWKVYAVFISNPTKTVGKPHQFE